MNEPPVNIRFGRRSLLIYSLRHWSWKRWGIVLVWDETFFKHFPNSPWFACYRLFGWEPC